MPVLPPQLEGVKTNQPDQKKDATTTSTTLDGFRAFQWRKCLKLPSNWVPNHWSQIVSLRPESVRGLARVFWIFRRGWGTKRMAVLRTKKLRQLFLSSSGVLDLLDHSLCPDVFHFLFSSGAIIAVVECNWSMAETLGYGHGSKLQLPVRNETWR